MGTEHVITLPRTRQHRLLKLLGLSADEGILEILLTPTGGLVTRYKTGPDGKFVTNPTPFDGEPILVTETVEIVFVDEPDPLNASLEYRMHKG